RVLPIVQPDAEHLARTGGGRSEQPGLEGRSLHDGDVGGGRPGAELLPVGVERRHVRAEATTGRLLDVDPDHVTRHDRGASSVVGQAHGSGLARPGAAPARRREARGPPFARTHRKRSCSVVCALGGTKPQQPIRWWSGWTPPSGPTNRSAASHLQGPGSTVMHAWTTSFLWWSHHTNGATGPGGHLGALALPDRRAR